MAGINMVILQGNLAKEPTASVSKSGTSISKFVIIVNDEKKNTDSFMINVFGKQADACNKYLTKGRGVTVIGTLKNNNYKNADGKMVFGKDNILAKEVHFGAAGAKNRTDDDEKGEIADVPDYGLEAGFEDITDDDIVLPF